MKQIGWNLNRSNGVTTRTTAYQAELDNGRTVLLRVVTQDGIEGIAGIHFSDITDFLASTEAFVPTVRVILWGVSALAMAFTVWMLVLYMGTLRPVAMWRTSMPAAISASSKEKEQPMRKPT